MDKIVYIGVIKNDEADVKTLVNAENESEAKKLVLEKFKGKLFYTEKDVIIIPFNDVYGEDKA